MTGRRIEGYGQIDRGRQVSFRFDGRPFTGFAGDTVASALLASGVRIFGRSFKYHRPRGVWGAWTDDPNAIVDISLNGATFPNCQATTTALVDGMEIRSVNAWPNASFDVKAGLDLLQRFLPAGFYYKMFMWPDWHLFEPSIRKMAGLGTLTDDVLEGYVSPQLHEACDVVVVGGGLCGLTAARSAAEAGEDVLMIDDHPHPGGRNLSRKGQIEGMGTQQWIAAQIAAIKAAGGRVLPSTTAIGVYDHQLVSLVEDRGLGRAPVVRRVRARRMVMATGAFERPVTFADNDRPGVMSLDGAVAFLNRYGVLVGQDVALLTNRPDAEDLAGQLEDAGARTRLFDAGQATARAIGRRGVSALDFGGRKTPCDLILASAGHTPAIHLWRHAGGRLDWLEDSQAFVPGTGPDWIRVIGSANGTSDLETALQEGDAAGRATGAPPRKPHKIPALWPDTTRPERQWLDFQHDVTVKDIALAKRENMVSVEHLKRYTTLGMAGDQGKTSNMPGLATMAGLEGKTIPEVGTTTFRPPFVPIPLETYSGARKNRAIAALKRLPLEPEHRKQNAALGEYGGWLRPAWYGDTDAEAQAVARECLMARKAAAIMDASSLGKIEVAGPDARAFVNFVYYNTMSNLKPGRIRYGFLLHENGRVLDDGVVTCMDDTRFLVSCSSSHVAQVYAHLEHWRQDSFDPARVFLHDTTQNWATVTIAGPKAPEIVEKLGILDDLSDFPHMSLRMGTFNESQARVARVSFTGDASFEISVQHDQAAALWTEALRHGAPLGAGPVGVEALTTLRAEKGYILVGQDTEAETMPHDLGFAAPRLRKTAAFVGDRSLHTEEACKDDRKQLVGLDVPKGDAMLPIGAHVVAEQNGKTISLGYVTSSYESPSLNRPIALALVAGGSLKTGETVTVWHLGERRRAQLRPACAWDPEGERLNA